MSAPRKAPSAPRRVPLFPCRLVRGRNFADQPPGSADAGPCTRMFGRTRKPRLEFFCCAGIARRFLKPQEPVCRFIQQGVCVVFVAQGHLCRGLSVPPYLFAPGSYPPVHIQRRPEQKFFSLGPLSQERSSCAATFTMAVRMWRWAVATEISRWAATSSSVKPPKRYISTATRISWGKVASTSDTIRI